MTRARSISIAPKTKYESLHIEHNTEFYFAHSVFFSIAQAMMYYRIADTKAREDLYACTTLDAAKQVSFNYEGPLSHNWLDNGPGNVIYSLARARFDADEGARELLLSTENSPLVVYGDDLVLFVDKQSKQGLNTYGKVLMQLRAWYRFMSQVLGTEEMSSAGDIIIQR